MALSKRWLIFQDQIVWWLNTMRLGVGGFISTVDTVVALEALVKYGHFYNTNPMNPKLPQVLLQQQHQGPDLHDSDGGPS